MHRGGAAEVATALGILGLAQVPPAGAGAHNFPAGRNLKPLGRGLLGSDAFWTSHKSIHILFKGARNIGGAASRIKGYFAHFGNWELNALVTKSHLAVPCIAVEKVQSNPLIHKCIHEYRKKFGAIVLPMELSIREILKTLQAGGAVAMAVDQAAAKESVGVEFFGRVVPTFQGPAVFSLRTGAPILIGLAVRQADGTYRVMFHKVPSDDLDGASEKNIVELTQRHIKLTEQLIREHPEQWMWMHKRWKHVPDRVYIPL